MSEARFKESVKLLMRDLDTGDAEKTAERVARVLDASVGRVLEAFDGRRRPSPRKGVKLGPRPGHWRRPGPSRGDACGRGHPLTEANTITRANGSRTCRACHREAVRRHERKRPPRDRRGGVVVHG